MEPKRSLPVWRSEIPVNTQSDCPARFLPHLKSRDIQPDRPQKRTPQLPPARSTAPKPVHPISPQSACAFTVTPEKLYAHAAGIRRQARMRFISIYAFSAECARNQRQLFHFCLLCQSIMFTKLCKHNKQTHGHRPLRCPCEFKILCPQVVSSLNMDFYSTPDYSLYYNTSYTPTPPYRPRLPSAR